MISKLPVLRRLQQKIRRKRLRQFVDGLRVSTDDLILDVGGTPYTWTMPETNKLRAVMLNLYAAKIDESEVGRLQSVAGDACELSYGDSEFEIVFSNSVIEHVGTYENQEKMAAELRRVGKRLWVQTPARGFFFEPHYVTPFIHWFPKGMRRKMIRWFTLWGLRNRPTAEQVQKMIDEIRLLTYDEMKKLFPDCEIHRERFLGMTKSYIALRV